MDITSLVVRVLNEEWACVLVTATLGLTPGARRNPGASRLTCLLVFRNTPDG